MLPYDAEGHVVLCPLLRPIRRWVPCCWSDPRLVGISPKTRLNGIGFVLSGEWDHSTLHSPSSVVLLQHCCSEGPAWVASAPLSFRVFWWLVPSGSTSPLFVRGSRRLLLSSCTPLYQQVAHSSELTATTSLSLAPPSNLPDRLQVKTLLSSEPWTADACPYLYHLCVILWCFVFTFFFFFFLRCMYIYIYSGMILSDVFACLLQFVEDIFSCQPELCWHLSSW
jgi:hypothetical protein